tara:strand:+ start:965 stop:1231 length:267 start_codon:yes stop_codon:yes gene_type:complete
MANTLDEFVFSDAGRKRKYNWNLWLDGRIWELKRPDDFQCSAKIMRTGAFQAGNKRNLKVRTTIVDDDTLVIQSYRDGINPDNRVVLK